MYNFRLKTIDGLNFQFYPAKMPKKKYFFFQPDNACVPYLKFLFYIFCNWSEFYWKEDGWDKGAGYGFNQYCCNL